MAKPGHRAPERYDESAFPSFAVTVDIVILTMVEGRLHVLLVRRSADPYAGSWALPGGFKRPNETLDQAARRELREESGVVAPKHLAQFGAYGDPGRDPRTNVVTVGYLAVTPEVGEIHAATDAKEARLWPIVEAVRDLTLAFDHRRILSDAVDRAADQLEQTDLATAFVGETFALSELQNVYEELWQADIDPANFRRSLTTAPPDAAAPAPAPDTYVEPTGERAKASPRGGRPPELFRAGTAWSAQPPVRRPRKSSARKPDRRGDDD
jgi:8-oxo-dGTP diphosphatase